MTVSELLRSCSEDICDAALPEKLIPGSGANVCRASEHHNGYFDAGHALDRELCVSKTCTVKPHMGNACPER